VLFLISLNVKSGSSGAGGVLTFADSTLYEWLSGDKGGFIEEIRRFIAIWYCLYFAFCFSLIFIGHRDTRFLSALFMVLLGATFFLSVVVIKFMEVQATISSLIILISLMVFSIIGSLSLLINSSRNTKQE
jgi:hypothetical protein